MIPDRRQFSLPLFLLVCAFVVVFWGFVFVKGFA